MGDSLSYLDNLLIVLYCIVLLNFWPTLPSQKKNMSPSRSLLFSFVSLFTYFRSNKLWFPVTQSYCYSTTNGNLVLLPWARIRKELTAENLLVANVRSSRETLDEACQTERHTKQSNVSNKWGHDYRPQSRAREMRKRKPRLVSRAKGQIHTIHNTTLPWKTTLKKTKI